MDTRTQELNGYFYCAYCGKELKNANFSMWPTPDLKCDCEKAQEELKLYADLKALYSSPIAECLVDKLVDNYRNELLGVKRVCNNPSLNQYISVTDCHSTALQYNGG